MAVDDDICEVGQQPRGTIAVPREAEQLRSFVDEAGVRLAAEEVVVREYVLEER